VTSQGDYELIVTHIGEQNGVIVEVVESAIVTIEAMRINVIEIIPGFVGEVFIEPGGGEVGPDYAEVEAILQIVFGAPYAQRDLLYVVDTPEGPAFTVPDGSFTLSPSQVSIFVEYSEEGKPYSVSGTGEAISIIQTSVGMDIESIYNLTIEGGSVSVFVGTAFISATMDFSGGGVTDATITGTATADGVEYDISGMDLAQYWIQGINFIMLELS
jgi:hypothetical protein